MLLTNNQRYFILILFIVIMGSFVTLGCSNQAESEGSTVLPNEGDVIKGSRIDLDDFVHFNVNETLYYKGVADFSQVASCVRIDELISPDSGKLYYFEGEVDDLSGGIAGDPSFYKAYKVTEAYCSEYYDDENEMILLKSEIEEGTTWNTMMIDPQLGLVEIIATIKSIKDDEITVNYTFVDNQNIQSDKRYTLEYVFKVGKGIVKKKQIYSDYEIEFNLTQKSTDPPSTFVERYNKPSDFMAQIYSDTYFEDLVSDAKFKTNVRVNQFSDKDLYQSYEEYLGTLKANQIRSISRAKNALKLCLNYTENPFDLVRQFISFYERNCNDYGYEWVGKLEIYDMTLFDALFIYDDHAKQFVVNPEAKGENRVLSAFLMENGIAPKLEEGYPYFSTNADFLSQDINVNDSLTKDYVTFKKLQYNLFPIQSDGYLMVSADQLADAIKNLDAQYQKHKDLQTFEEAKYLADYLFELYILPNDYFSEDYNYSGGYLTATYRESYELYIKENSKSSYTPILINIMDLLKSSDGAYSEALDHYLIDLGYTPSSEAFDLKFLQMDEFKKITMDKNRISLNPKASQVVSVSDIEAFIAAVGPNKTIYLEAGLYEIPNTLKSSNAYVEIEEGTLRIKNVENMTILSTSGVVDLIADSYFEVLVIDGCKNIQLDGIRVGHLREYCVGDVIEVKASSSIELNRMILFGCGYNGLSLDSVTGLSLSNTLISDCQSSGLVFKDTENISITNTRFFRDGRQLFDFKNSKNIILKQVIAANNDKEAYETANALMVVDENSDITLVDSELDTTFVKKMVEGEGVVTQ